jgi:6-O-methylguanine DNA methyltransferase, DNA binding domain
MKTRTSWRAKLAKPQQPKLVKVPPKMSRFGKGTMLIPTPILVDEVLQKVPKGKLVTVGEIRRRLANDFSADVTCPLTTGIFIRIVAEAAEENRAHGRMRVTPYWRVVKDDGALNPKFPGGVTNQARYLRAEGFAVAGNRVVGDLAPHLFQFR